MEAKKKSANFTKAEVDAIISDVETKKEVLFGKLGPGLSGDMKKQAWEEVAAKVNEVGVGEMRMEKAVRKKWTDMASMTKKKESARRREMSATGGGECAVTMTDAEVKVVELLTEEAIGGVAGGMDIGVISQMTVGDVKHVLMPTENECSGSGVTDYGAKEAKKSSKRARVTDVGDVTEIELRRLDVKERRLAIEKQRLDVEEKRLKVE